MDKNCFWYKYYTQVILKYVYIENFVKYIYWLHARLNVYIILTPKNLLLNSNSHRQYIQIHSHSFWFSFSFEVMQLAKIIQFIFIPVGIGIQIFVYLLHVWSHIRKKKPTFKSVYDVLLKLILLQNVIGMYFTFIYINITYVT